jgi:hypothetical protein
MQMPGWGRRLRIMIDWIFALFFRPDIVKFSLDRDGIERHDNTSLADPSDQGKARNAASTSGGQLAAATPT